MTQKIVFGEQGGNRVMYADRNLEQMFTLAGYRALRNHLFFLKSALDVIHDDIEAAREGGFAHVLDDILLASNEKQTRDLMLKIQEVEDYFIETGVEYE